MSLYESITVSALVRSLLFLADFIFLLILLTAYLSGEERSGMSWGWQLLVLLKEKELQLVCNDESVPAFWVIQDSGLKLQYEDWGNWYTALKDKTLYYRKRDKKQDIRMLPFIVYLRTI